MQTVNDILLWWYGSHSISECNGWWVSQYLAVALFVFLLILFSVSGSMNDQRLLKVFVLLFVSAMSIVAFTLIGPFALVIAVIYILSVLISPKD